MSNASRAAGDSGADAAETDDANGLARELAETREVPVLRWLVEPDVRHVLLERQHGAEDELGDGDRARPPGRR